jgi:signal peptidase I
VSESKLTINDLPSQMSQSSSKLLRISSAALVIPPLIYFNDTFFSIQKVKNDHMVPDLKQGDLVLVQKGELLPAFFHSKITANDLVDDNDRLGEDIDRRKSLRMDAAAGKAPTDNFTFWRSPPILMPGEVAVFTNPQDMGSVEIKRVVGLGGQRMRPKASLHKIEYVDPYSLWLESDNQDNGNYNGSVSKKLLRGRAVRVIWPLDRWKDVTTRKPQIGRAWWP